MRRPSKTAATTTALPLFLRTIRYSLLGCLVVLTGCAGHDQEREFVPPVFPPPPDEPRFIYERTIKYNDNVEGTSTSERFRRFATGAPREVKGLIKPFGVAVQNGRLYVADTVQRAVILFDIPGGRYIEIGLDDPGALVKPVGIDISSQGEIFVSDVTARHIVVYDLEGVFQRYIGDKDLLVRPSGVALSPDASRVYVVDTGGVDSDAHHVQVFDARTGAHLHTIGRRGSADGEFNLPLQAATGPDGTLYVVDKGNFRVQAFHPNGSFAFKFGTAGRLPGHFFSPKGITTDGDGNIYVVDTAFGNFQIFNKKGQLLMFVGDRGHSGAPAKYMLPAGIDVDNDGRIYIADQFFRKIDVFRPVALDPQDNTVANGTAP